jgi:hypothetical protein
MKQQANISSVKKIMTEFSDSTGLSIAEKSPRRYLWTDAFAVCNFLELYQRTGDEIWQNLALRLVDQVHYILGRHREDDPRTGWISGYTEDEGRKHPTIGGLRIGKKMNERKPDDIYDDHLEWNRDGQYYHYLTKWMQALNSVSRSTGNPIFNLWAIELAKATHAGFVHGLNSGSKGMYWKMSIDLSYALVPSMGHHDPLDGLITYNQIQATAVELFNASGPDLDLGIADMELLCQGKNWVTNDPLGLGGLLCNAYAILQLMVQDRFAETRLLEDLLESSLASLDTYMLDRFLSFSAEYRLAFRELGMAIGLHAVERIEGLIQEKPDVLDKHHPVYSQIKHLRPFIRLGEAIEKFWLKPQNRMAKTWTEHQDINSVMLATSLFPDGYLKF